MTAIQIKFPALTLKAGQRALLRIRQQGLKPADVGILPGAAGGPKALAFRAWIWPCLAIGCPARPASGR